ncbi:MAG: hypothetical protein OXF94_08725 [Gammaproteobacteria bacterium]|nr:hypothetical protein [Gammaproteobacteria bacterium]
MIPVLRPAILLGLAAFLALPSQPTRGDGRQGNPEGPTHCVVLLHGIGGFALLLKSMELSLEEQGYFVANVTYPSLADPIESLAVEAVEEGLERCAAQGLSRIHFVTHSMGGYWSGNTSRKSRLRDLRG